MDNFKKRADIKQQELARNKLFNQCSKRINTTMIGAIATLEKYFSDHPDFTQIRSEILDKGNNQIRNLHVDFDPYNVNFKNSIVLPIERK